MNDAQSEYPKAQMHDNAQTPSWTRDVLVAMTNRNEDNNEKEWRKESKCANANEWRGAKWEQEWGNENVNE